MNEEEITFEKLPEAVAKILSEVSKIRDLVAKDRELVEKRKPLEIEDACKIIKKAKATVYALARKNQIPCSKIQGKLYFFEDQLLNWIDLGKRKTPAEIKNEIESELKVNKTKRPTRRN